VLVVDCDEETQIKRLLARDAETRDQARRILSAQASRQERLAVADDVIYNGGDLEVTRASVTDLDRTYRRLASRRVQR
jgi:dephospho-CoA kinase